MEIDGDGELVLTQEGAAVRAVAGDLNILLPKSIRDAVVEAYNTWRPKVRAHFEPRWRAYAGTNIAEADLNAIVREVTLHWMAFCVMHGMPVRMGPVEWDQPMTRRIIRAAVERRFGRGSEEAMQLCAQMMGISRDDFARWAEADESFLGMM